MNLWQQSHSRIATSAEPPKKPTEAMKMEGVTRRRIDRHKHTRKLKRLVSANADIDELERMIDELED